MSVTTVFACESQPIVLEGLDRVLTGVEDLVLVGSTAVHAEALARIGELRPQIVLLDQSGGLKLVFRFLADVRSACATAMPVLWVSELAEVECFRALQLGARGILKKTLPVAVILECLRSVARGNIWIEHTVSSQVVGFLNRRQTPRLTPREREIVRCLCRGMRNKEIATELSITPGTVKVHLMHIFEKTGVKDRFELAIHGRKLLGGDADDAVAWRVVSGLGRLAAEGIDLTNSIGASNASLAKGRDIHGSSWARVLLPSISDCLFLAFLVWLFSAGSGGLSGLLSDGDSGWHIRTGEWILANHTVPRQDLFSFSKAGEAWYAWEWLTDVSYALLHRAAGLKGLVLVSALMIAGFGTILFRHMIAAKATPFAALITSLLVFGASSIHYLARPHVVTLFGMVVALWMVDADRRSQSRAIWLLVPITVVWVNMHGGFLGLIACLGLLVIGTFLEEALAALADRRKWDFSLTARYALLATLCSAATFVNPYGWHLHKHVAAYLQSDWIRNTIQEFQSPVFRSESALQYEIMLFLGMMTVLWLLARCQLVPALWILFWAHQSLISARHMPLFMITAAPWVAAGLTAIWRAHIDSAQKKTLRGIFSSLAAQDMERGCSRTSIWIAVAALFLAFLPEASMRWPNDFPAVRFPVQMVARHAAKLSLGRVLTMDQWADYLIYRNYPKQRVFVDGRSDFFGKEIGEQYLRMTQGHWEWEQLLEKYRFDVVLSPVEWPLTSLLKKSRKWRVVEDDGQAILFEKVDATGPLVPVPSAHVSAPEPRKKPAVI